MRKFILIILIVIYWSCPAQLVSDVGLAVSNNVSSYPGKGFPKLFYSAFHPGLDIIFWKALDKKKQFWLEIDLGAFYHRLIQTAFKVNSNIHYRYSFNTRLFADAGFGAGYLHSFMHYSVFKLNEHGNYEKVSYYKGRAQFLVLSSLGIGVSLKKRDPDKLKLFFQYRTFAHGIFARNYAPAITYNAVLIGIHYKINTDLRESN